MQDSDNITSKVIKDILKKIGTNLVQGKVSDVMKIRTPAYCHAPLTYLDICKGEFSTLECFIFHAQSLRLLENPLERLKLITTAIIA